MDANTLNLFNETDTVAWVGAGGKSSLIFYFAKNLFTKCVISTSTHLANTQKKWAEQFSEINSLNQLKELSLKDYQGAHLITEIELKTEPGKLLGLRKDFMDLLINKCKYDRIPLFIEADGSKNRPIKAPASHEPAIPLNVNKVCVVAGLSAIGKPINSNFVHRTELVAKILHKLPSENLTLDDYYLLLTSNEGGLKSIPEGIKKYLFLNQSDLLNGDKSIYKLALKCKRHFDHVLITYYDKTTNLLDVKADFEQVGCILLAAGESKRFGSPKQLAKWHDKTFFETVINNISVTTLKPVVVVTGAYQELLNPIISNYTNIINIFNPKWKDGQSESIKIGVEAIKNDVNAVIFLLVDQPQISSEMINRILIEYARTKTDIIAYEYNGKLRHPVLFSRVTFGDLKSIQGDTGGRQLFKNYSPLEIPINDSFYAMDFDTPEELAKFIESY